MGSNVFNVPNLQRVSDAGAVTTNKLTSSVGFNMSTTGGCCARIPVNSYFGGIDASPTSGLYFNNVNKSVEIHSAGTPYHTFFIGALNSGAYLMGARTTDAPSSVNGCLENFDNGAGLFYPKVYNGAAWSKLSVNGQYFSTTPIGTTGGGESDLHSYTVPAKTLEVDGESLAFRCGGTCAVTTVQFRAYLGSSLVFDSGAPSLTDGTTWELSGWIIRVDANNQKCVASLVFNDSKFFAVSDYKTATEDLGMAVVFKITGETGGMDEIVEEMFKLFKEDSSI